MERRFVIKECPATGDIHNFSITESELKRRLAIIAPIELTHDNGDPMVDDEDINILVNGYRRKE